MRVRQYISWSQIQALESGKYIERYLMDKTFYNKYQEFGSMLHEVMESPSKNKEIERLKLFLPKYQKREIKIKTKIEGIPILGKLDGLNIKGRNFCDYKTGKKFTQAMADKTGQITFYYILLWKKFNWLPKKALIHWLETIEENGVISLTGKIQTFETKRTMKDLMLFYQRIKRAYEEIGKLCDNYINKRIK